MRGYNVPLPVLTTGGAAQTSALNGRVPPAPPSAVRSAHDTSVYFRDARALFENVERCPGVAGCPVRSPRREPMNFFIISLIKAAIVAFVLMTTLAYLQWIERKVIAHIQLRVGPSPRRPARPAATARRCHQAAHQGGHDSLPREQILLPARTVHCRHDGADPDLASSRSGREIEVFGVRTWMQLTDLNIGVLFILAISSVGVYGVALAGWSSNNKYALLGGLRSSAQMISYELPMALALAAPLLIVNTLSLRDIVEAQSGFYFGFLPRWTIFQGPCRRSSASCSS